MTKITWGADIGTTVLQIDTRNFENYPTLHLVAVIHDAHNTMFTSNLATEQLKYMFVILSSRHIVEVCNILHDF